MRDLSATRSSRGTHGPPRRLVPDGSVLALLLVLALAATGWGRSPAVPSQGSAPGCPPAVRSIRLPDRLPAGPFGRALITAGDLDGDGFGDLVLAGEKALWVVPGPGLARPRLLLAARDGSAGRPAALTTADIDGDGAAEIAVGFPDAAPEQRARAGEVILLDGRTGAILHRIAPPKPSAGDRFGAAVAGPPSGAGADSALLLIAGSAAPTVYALRKETGALRVEPTRIALPRLPAPEPTAAAPPSLVRWLEAGDEWSAAAWPGADAILLGRPGQEPARLATPGSQGTPAGPLLVTGDLTGEGRIDLLALRGRSGASPARSWRGLPALLVPGPTYASVATFRALALDADAAPVAGETDGDGLLDLVSSRRGRPILRRGGLLGRDQPLGAAGQPPLNGVPALMADLTADGLDELVLAGPEPAPPWTGIQIVDFSTRHAAVAYGLGRSDAAGFLPRLELDGPLRIGTVSRLRITNGLGGARALLIMAREAGTARPRPGLSLLVDRPTHIHPVRLAGPPGVAGAGWLEIPLEIPHRELFIGGRLAVQCLVYDPGLPERIAASRGLLLTIQPPPPPATVKTMKEWRFRPTLEGRPLGFLLAKSLLLVVLLGAALLIRRRAGLWTAPLALAGLLLAINILLDLGQVGLAYNRPDRLGPSALSPLFAYFAPSWRWPAFLHLGLVGGLLLLGTRRILTPTWRPIGFAGLLLALGTVAPLTLALSSPPAQILQQFFRSGLDYAHHARAIGDVGTFLRGYVEMMPQLSMHASTHGPGPILILALLLEGLHLGEMTSAIVLLALSSLLPLLTYIMARPLARESAARLAGLLVCLSPSYLLYSFVGMTGFFSLFIIAAAAVLLACLRAQHRPIAGGLALGVLIYAAAFQTFSVAFLAPLGIACGGLAALRGLISWRRLGAIALTGALSFLVVHLAVRALTGFDLVACYQTAREIIANGMGLAKRSASHYVFGVTGNLTAWLLACGIPVSAHWLVHLREIARRRDLSDTLVIGAAAAIALLALAGVYQWEVERIWLFLVPIAAIGAARRLDALRAVPGRAASVLLVVWLQAVVWELALETYW